MKRFVCKKCRGWLWSEMSGQDGETIINDSLTCIDCDPSVRGRMLLTHYLRTGQVTWSSQEKTYLGLASDGVLVNLGDRREQVEKYLETYSHPDQW